MTPPARPLRNVVDDSLLSVFTGTRVRIGEQQWSSSFAAQLSACAASAPTLVVLAGGKAMLGGPESAIPFAEQVERAWEATPAHRPSRFASRTLGACIVLRFDAEALAAARRPALSPAPAEEGRIRSAGPSLVQLGPGAVFRLHWRRRALALGYPAPESHVEGDAMALLRHVLVRAWPCGQPVHNAFTPRQARHRSLALNAQAIMARSLSAAHPIAELARTLHTSPFHLAHVFRTEIGLPLHRCLVQLRLVAAVERLRDGAPDLSKLALELGFSHHSHFSSAFRRAVGYSPRDVREMLTAETIAGLGIADRHCC